MVLFCSIVNSCYAYLIDDVVELCLCKPQKEDVTCNEGQLSQFED